MKPETHGRAQWPPGEGKSEAMRVGIAEHMPSAPAPTKITVETIGPNVTKCPSLLAWHMVIFSISFLGNTRYVLNLAKW